jgi:SAM-dependent methyltransferase
VRDLNREPDGWAAADASFNAVLCCVSVQYLQQPERVFSEIYRVLKPQGVCIISFSNRLYSTKGAHRLPPPPPPQAGFLSLSTQFRPSRQCTQKGNFYELRNCCPPLSPRPPSPPAETDRTHEHLVTFIHPLIHIMREVRVLALKIFFSDCSNKSMEGYGERLWPHPACQAIFHVHRR